jgi:hypothetical protein
MWEIKDEQGHFHQGQEALKTEAKRYFSSFYKESVENRIVEQVESVRLFPRMVTVEDLEVLEKPVSEKEILEVLKGFSKRKKPRA